MEGSPNGAMLCDIAPGRYHPLLEPVSPCLVSAVYVCACVDSLCLCVTCMFTIIIAECMNSSGSARTQTLINLTVCLGSRHGRLLRCLPPPSCYVCVLLWTPLFDGRLTLDHERASRYLDRAPLPWPFSCSPRPQTQACAYARVYVRVCVFHSKIDRQHCSTATTTTSSSFTPEKGVTVQLTR